MYERLEKNGKLLKSDTESMNIGYSCLVGTTEPLDPEKYPIVKDDFTHFAVVIADDKPHSVACAVNALEDAVIMANCIYELSSTSQSDIEAALNDYKEQRFPHAKYQ
ncbi:hypothetical protein BGX27_010405, partial [Mortierella sp. AM989]